MERTVLLISKDEMGKMIGLASSAYPIECCGLLIGFEVETKRTVREARPCLNEAPKDLRVRYKINPRTLLETEREIADSGKIILGIYHSHPDYSAHPSKYDLAHAWPWYSYLILSVDHGHFVEASSWRLTNDLSKFREEEWRVPESP